LGVPEQLPFDTRKGEDAGSPLKPDTALRPPGRKTSVNHRIWRAFQSAGNICGAIALPHPWIVAV
jgi:hypothetical protein